MAQSRIEQYIQKLTIQSVLEKQEYLEILQYISDAEKEVLFANARKIREQHYGKAVYLRGLIEFTNYCKNNCYYCGIRCENKNIQRYRLTKEEILRCVQKGYALGFRSFVLQGGEDKGYSPHEIGEIVSKIKRRFPDCAVTLSIGEHPREIYQFWYDCGADRYLLRHETADKSHYEMLHPTQMSFAHRMECLSVLKDIGYQVGAGFMVGSPYQTITQLAEELLFLKQLEPHMVGIGPFIAQKDSPFSGFANGTAEKTVLMLALIRLTLPHALLPATTALGTICPNGRELGILAGANVLMPNLSPVSVRENYALYDNKLTIGNESAQNKRLLEKQLRTIGYEAVCCRGDYK